MLCAYEKADNPLLLTKLNRPRLRPDLVHRPRLLSQLQSPSSLERVALLAVLTFETLEALLIMDFKNGGAAAE